MQPFRIKKPRLARRVDASQSFCSELQEELMAVGYAEELHLLAIVEPCGYFYAHRMCAIWSKGVKVVNNDDTNAGPSVVSVCSASSWPEVAGADSALIQAAFLRCHLCGSFGASLSCQQATTVWPKSFHFPCGLSFFERQNERIALSGSYSSGIDHGRPIRRQLCRLSFPIQCGQSALLRDLRKTLPRLLCRTG